MGFVHLIPHNGHELQYKGPNSGTGMGQGQESGFCRNHQRATHASLRGLVGAPNQRFGNDKLCEINFSATRHRSCGKDQLPEVTPV